MDSMKEEELECAVCLQTCVHPVKLPCSHIFCFLCVKGVANQSKRCAMCRQEIPADYLDNPNLLRKIKEKETEIEGYQWFYEGRNGWWQYDERTSGDLETFYNAGQRVCEVLVAGFLYTIDFDRMLQQRRNDPSRRRRIKRDMSSIPKKGVAGLKTFEDNATEEPLLCENDDGDHLNIEANNVDDISEISPITVPIVNLSSTVTDNTENSSSTETANTPVPSELSHVRLLFSNFYRNFHPPRRDLPLGSGPLSHPSYPLTRNRALRIREQLAQATSQSPCPSTGVNETELHCNLVHPSNESCPISARESVTIDDITNNLVELSVNEEEDVQYYSLNDTEEYRLPNEDEL